MASQVDICNDLYQDTATHADAVAYLSTLPVRVLSGLADLNSTDMGYGPGTPAKRTLVKRLAADRHPTTN